MNLTMEAVIIRKALYGWYIAMAIGLISFIAIASFIPEQGGHSFDRWAQQMLASWKGDGMTSAMKLLSYLGSTVSIIVITLASAVFFGIRSGWRYAMMIIGGVLGGYVLNTLLKNCNARIRPEEAWGVTADGASFPSGNAMLGIIMFGLILYAIWQESGASRQRKAGMAILLAVLVFLMGLSRVYFHVHYITDVLAGYSAGLIVVSATILLGDQAIYQRRREGKSV